MATAVKENSQNGKLETKTRAEAFDFMNSPPDIAANEVLRRNWGKHSSVAQKASSDPCFCGKIIKPKQRYWPASSKRNIHKQCIIGNVSASVAKEAESWDDPENIPKKGARKKAIKAIKAVEEPRQKRKYTRRADKVVARPSSVLETRSEISDHLQLDESQFVELSNVQMNFNYGLLLGQVKAHEAWLTKLPEILRSAGCREE